MVLYTLRNTEDTVFIIHSHHFRSCLLLLFTPHFAVSLFHFMFHFLNGFSAPDLLCPTHMQDADSFVGMHPIISHLPVLL